MTTDSTTQPTDAATPKASATKLAKKPVAKKKAPKPAKASKRPAVEINKSDEIRKLATAMKAKGTKPRPSVIVAELGAKGINVAAAQVSFVLKSMGFRPLRKRRKKGAAGAAAGAPKASAAAGAVSIDDLLAAKKAVVALGGSDRAVEAIQALKRLDGQGGRIEVERPIQDHRWRSGIGRALGGGCTPTGCRNAR